MRIGLLSPGEMGAAIATTLNAHGATVTTCVAGRSARTRGIAERAAIALAPTLADLVVECEVFLSVVPPVEAVNVARAVAAAKRSTGARPTYVDCNAIAPSTMREVAAIVGGDVIDVGIIGAPPRGETSPRLYASGAHADTLELSGLDVRAIGDEIGTASALKMCYAACTKGFTALATELLVAARLLGVGEVLDAELAASQPAQRDAMARQIPRMPTVAHRWIGEMEEIAKTFAGVGLTPRMFEGAADVFRFTATTSIGSERPETRDAERDMAATVEALARATGPVRMR